MTDAHNRDAYGGYKSMLPFSRLQKPSWCELINAMQNGSSYPRTHNNTSRRSRELVLKRSTTMSIVDACIAPWRMWCSMRVLGFLGCLFLLSDEKDQAGEKQPQKIYTGRERVQMGGGERGRDGTRAAGQFVTVQGVQPITGKQLLCSLDNCPRHCL